MGKAITVGILGAGFMGTRHAHSLQKLQGVKVAAICSRPLRTARALASSMNGEGTRAFADFDRMLREVPLDALYVCLPPFAHDGQVEAAAGKGIHVFVEKPVALTTRRAVAMARAVKRSGVVGQVGYHMRFGGAVRRLKELIDNGKAGIPTLFDARYSCNSLHGAWWKDRRKSGGQVFEQVIHLYDLALHLLGKPRAASGFAANLCHRNIRGYTVEDTSASAVRFASGALANISASNCAVPMEWNNPFTVVCENLTATFTDEGNAEFVFTNGGETKRRHVRGSTDPYLAETKAFVAAVQGKGPRVATIEEGALGVRLVDSVLRSSRAGGAVIKIKS